MSHAPQWSKVLVAAAVGTVLVAGALVAPAVAVAAPVLPAPPVVAKGLDARDRQLLTDARAAGRASVTLLVAAERGQAARAAAQIRAAGGTVVRTDTDVDYVRASVPLDRVERAAGVDAVQAVDVSGAAALDDPRPDSQTTPIRQPAPGKRTPRANAYLPTAETGSVAYAAAAPRNDGRGTTIAILDTGVDLGSAPLATTNTGARRIVDWYDALAPTDGDGGYVAVTGSYTGQFTVAGRGWTAPAAGGPYAFGVFAEAAGDLAGGEIGGDVNRDGDRTDTWGVLEDLSTKQVRVDLDADSDFTDEQAMTDYATGANVGWFGTDDPATPIAERMPFVVQTDHAGSVVIGVPSGVHGSHVAGIAAGRSLFGGQMSGAAPGASIMSVKVCLTSGCPWSALIEGVLYAARHGADVVNMSVGGKVGLNDGNTALAQVFNRTIAEYDMQIVLSAGNDGAGVNDVGDPAVTTDALAVGASVSTDTWLALYGARVSTAMGLFGFSSRGPREDGGFKPDLVAPGAAVSTVPTWRAGTPLSGTFALPPGYGMMQGTSMAAPQVAGALAQLVGVWKATHGGVRPDAAALRTAVKSTAEPIVGVPAYGQGAGLLDVPAAAALLARSPAPDTVTTSVPVSTVDAGRLATPGVGVGIHDREGVKLGRAYARVYTLTRTTGSARTVRYAATWVGDDGTFTSPATVDLPLNRPVRFRVAVSPSAAGVHSAVLQLDDPTTVGLDVQTLNTVVVPLAGAVSWAGSGTVDRAKATSRFVLVPAGASVLTVRLVGGGTRGKGQVRFLRFGPDGLGIDPAGPWACYVPDAGDGCGGAAATTRTVANPRPGVWEIVVEARWTSDIETVPWSLSVTALTAQVAPDPDAFTAAVGSTSARSVSVTNRGGAFVGRLVGSDLASTSTARPTVNGGGTQQQHPVQVPAGATSLTASIGNPADTAADLDLFLYDCTTGSCAYVTDNRGPGATETATVATPTAGLWVALVIGWTVPSGATAFDYSDTIEGPGLGAVVVTDTDAQRAPGATWQPGVQVQVAGGPGQGRVLTGTTSVVTAAGVRIGGSRVVVTIG